MTSKTEKSRFFVSGEVTGHGQVYGRAQVSDEQVSGGALFYYTVLWDSPDHPDVIISHIELAQQTVTLFYDANAAGYKEIMAAVAASENIAEDDLRSVTIHAIFPGHLQSLI